MKHAILDCAKVKRNYFIEQLKLLGETCDTYLATEVDENLSCRVLGRIGHDLSEYTDPVKTSFKNPEYDIVMDELIETTENNKSFRKNQTEFWKNIRRIYPDFALNMEGKVLPEEWELYSRMIHRTSNLLKCLHRGDSRFYKLSNRKIQDRISDLIDTDDFNKACEIEDRFMIDEYRNFITRAEALGQDDEEVRRTSSRVNLASLVRQAESSSRKKETYVQRYAEYRKFIDRLKSKVTIKPREHNGREGYSRRRNATSADGR